MYQFEIPPTTLIVDPPVPYLSESVG